MRPRPAHSTKGRRSRILRGLRRTILALTAVLVLLVGLVQPAGAAAPPVCTDADFSQGDCITTVLSDRNPDTSALYAGVAQAIERGQLDKAEHFASSLADSVDLQVRRSVSGLVSDARAVADRGGDPREVGSAAAVRVTDPGAEGSRTHEAQPLGSVRPMDMGDGYVSGITHYLTDTATYGYCNQQGNCALVGKVLVEFRYTLFTAFDYVLSGDLTVTQGPRVAFPEVRCRTRYEQNFLPDITVHTWSGCTDVQSSVPTFYTGLYGDSWTGGSFDERYHPDYYIEFKSSASGSPTFIGSWRADSYYISNQGIASWL